jgi:hypothetical protein
MPLNRNAAARLLSASEMTLFEAALRDAIGLLGKAQVHATIKRARRLRDKYRDLFRRQQVLTRKRIGSKTGPGGDANVRTREKAAIMDELLARFAKRLDEIESAERHAIEAAAKAARRARKAAAKTGATAARKRTAGAGSSPKGQAGFMSEGARSASLKRRQHKSRGVAIHAHLRSQGRRNQARRDRRR